ncbi:MAG: hypothetical protein II697_01740 [Clostridia bacterium]|nr:hypothetical protein [Clostridia bacterium]
MLYAGDFGITVRAGDAKEISDGKGIPVKDDAQIAIRGQKRGAQQRDTNKNGLFPEKRRGDGEAGKQDQVDQPDPKYHARQAADIRDTRAFLIYDGLVFCVTHLVPSLRDRAGAARAADREQAGFCRHFKSAPFAHKTQGPFYSIACCIWRQKSGTPRPIKKIKRTIARIASASVTPPAASFLPAVPARLTKKADAVYQIRGGLKAEKAHGDHAV